MSIEILTIALFGSMILGLLSGFPIAFVLAGVGLLFSYFVWGPQSLVLIAFSTWDSMSSFILMAIPLFIFVGIMLEKSGLADALYNALGLWTGPLKGGLAIVSIAICTVIAAMVGVIGAGIMTVGLIALPEMLKRGYDKHIAMGAIMSGGALGALIPPSIPMILYSSVTQQSVGSMFMGGILPGLLLSTLYMGFVGIRCALRPELGPVLPPEERAKVTWAQRFSALRGILLPLAIILSVLGSIFAGIATPTEASSVACVGAIIAAAIYRRLSWKILKETAYSTARLFGMVLWILIGATVFNRFYTAMGAQHFIQNALAGAGVNPWMILIFMQLILIIVGMFMEDLAILMIIPPIFNPVIISLGFDPLWFALVFIVNLQISLLTPPYGFALFFMKAVVPDESLSAIWRSIIPFVMLQVIGLILCLLFPQIILWLPNLMK